jgi:flagellar biosynthesis/type III secretory pathway chaperone
MYLCLHESDSSNRPKLEETTNPTTQYVKTVIRATHEIKYTNLKNKYTIQHKHENNHQDKSQYPSTIHKDTKTKQHNNNKIRKVTLVKQVLLFLCM